MVLNVSAHPGAWLDGVAVAGQDLRLQLASAFLTGASPSGTTGIAARPGVRYGTGSPLLVAAASGMNLTVNAGVAFVQGTASATAGMYTCCLDTTGTITVATSDPTNPRIDNVICQVIDLGTSGSTTVVTLQTGTPAPSPAAPALPANSLLLATVAVAANAVTVTGANITDARVYTSAAGGILPVANTSGGISGPSGLYVHNLASGRMQVSDGAGNARAPKTGAFAPAVGAYGSATVSGAGLTVLSSTTVTVDGATEVQMTGTWSRVAMAAPNTADIMAFTFTVDGSIPSGMQQIYYRQDTASTLGGGGGMLIQHVTPAAGTRTIALVGLVVTAGSFLATNCQIRVSPSFA